MNFFYKHKKKLRNLCSCIRNKVLLTHSSSETHKKRIGLSYLVKKILYQMCDANIVKMPMSQQKFLEVLEFGDSIITVSHCLPTLFTLDA